LTGIIDTKEDYNERNHKYLNEYNVIPITANRRWQSSSIIVQSISVEGKKKFRGSGRRHVGRDTLNLQQRLDFSSLLFRMWCASRSKKVRVGLDLRIF
jgi:hypothetical protein